MFRQRPVDKKMVQIVLFLQTSKPGLQRQSLHKDQIVLSSCELIIAFCSNVTLQRAPKGPMFAKSTILKKTFGNQSRDLLVLTQTLPKAQRTRELSSSYQSNLISHITRSNTNLDQIRFS